MSSPIRSQAVNGGSRSRWYSVTMSKEERGRRTLTASLSRHMVGRRISIGLVVNFSNGSMLSKIQVK